MCVLQVKIVPYSEQEYVILSSRLLYALNSMEGVDYSHILEAANTEEMLLKTYKVELPALLGCAEAPGQEDNVAVEILKQFQPVMLKFSTPRLVYGDGNCLFRTVSLALFGRQRYHYHLRLLAALEIAHYRGYYDESYPNYVNLINDERVICSSYLEVLESACKSGAYSQMLHVYALSAALCEPLRMYYPSTGMNDNLAVPFSRQIIGRGVKNHSGTAGVWSIMWSQLHIPSHVFNFQPNHFVLQWYIPQTGNTVINLDDDDVLDSPQKSKPPVEITSSSEIHDSVDNLNIGGQDDELESSINSEPVNNNEKDQENSSEDEDAAVRRSLKQCASGTLAGTFLSTFDALDIIRTHEPVLPRVPLGPKDNMYFIIDNSLNVEKRQNNGKCDYEDDCGAWRNGCPTSKYIYVVGDDGKNTRIYLKDGKYCVERKVQKKVTYVQMDIQPADERILIIHRQYTTLKASASYQRRITWISKIPINESERLLHVALYEYKGVFPGLRPHGNARYSSSDYTKTPASVLTNIAAKCKNNAGPQAIYRKMCREEEIEFQPRKTKQIKNIKYKEQRKERSAQGLPIYRQNLADNVQVLENMVHQHPYVQQVINYKGASPSVILYTEDQIQDIKRLCSQGTVILGVDKTYNLSSMHVTATVFKQLSVVRESTDEHPLFIGPAFIHGHSTEKVFNSFFSQLAAELKNVDTSRLVIGSDEEKAIKNAIAINFPNASHALCTRHLKENTKRHLEDTGVNQQVRQQILDSIFGSRGISVADTQIVYEERVKNAKHIIDTYTSEETLNYFNNRLLPVIRKHVVTPYQQGFINENWTNNNSESINHMFKQCTGWKPQALPDLVHKMYELVAGQYSDLEKALFGMGNFRLAETHRDFYVSPAAWSLKSREERKKIYQKFLKGKNSSQRPGKFVFSTDGTRIVMNSPSGGKKPDQRKRKRTARTTTTTNVNKKLHM